MRDPIRHVEAIKRTLLDGGESEPTGVGPADRAIAIARRHPVALGAALAACGMLVASSPSMRRGLRHALRLSLRWLMTAVVVKELATDGDR